MKIKESFNVTFDETPPPYKTSSLVEDDLDEDDAVKVAEKKVLDTNIEDETLEVDKVVNIKESKNHPLGNIAGNLNLRTPRGRPSTSTSSSSAFGQPSSSRYFDDDNDGNEEGTSHAITPSLTRFVNSLSKDIPQVFSTPPNINPNMEAFYTRQTEILNRQFQLRDEKWGGLRSIEKGIKNLLRGKKK
ncbi:hypothetical protein Tco_0672212 [Tanacetum coccineum]